MKTFYTYAEARQYYLDIDILNSDYSWHSPTDCDNIIPRIKEFRARFNDVHPGFGLSLRAAKEIVEYMVRGKEYADSFAIAAEMFGRDAFVVVSDDLFYGYGILHESFTKATIFDREEEAETVAKNLKATVYRIPIRMTQGTPAKNYGRYPVHGAPKGWDYAGD